MKNTIQLKRVIALLIFCVMVVSANAQDTTSVTGSSFCMVTMTNGTKVSGLLVSQDAHQVVVSDPMLGRVTILQTNIEILQVVQTGSDYTFVMSSGKKYRGTVVSQDETSITINANALGEVKLNTINITSFSASGLSTDEITYDHGTRYLFAPSAIPLKKGEGYYQNIMILMNGFRYGVTNNVSVGGGIIMPIGFYADMKYGREISKNVHVAGGGMLISTLLGVGLGVGCGFGSVTVGDRWTNATFTMGFGAVMNDGDWNATKRPILNFSGMWKVTQGFSLVTENYFIPVTSYEYTNGYYSNPQITHHYRPQLSAGFRIGSGKHTFDVAGMSLGDLTQGNVYVIPYFSYAYHFNTNNK